MFDKAGGVEPRMEMLEDRRMLSTTVTYTPTSITIVGDTTKTGQINVTGNPGGNYVVTVAGESPVVKGVPPAVSDNVNITVSGGDAGRTINVTPNHARNVTVKGGKGTDAITVGSNVFGGNVTINGGEGTNILTVTGVDIGGNVVITGGAGPDTISMAAATGVNGNATISAGDGVNSVTLAYVRVGGNLVLNGGKDADTVAFGNANGTQLSGNVGIDTKGGDDVVRIGKGHYGATPVGKSPTTFGLKAGLGADTVLIGGVIATGAVVFAGNVRLDTGAGDDTLGIAGTFAAGTVDFEKASTILMGDGNDSVVIASGADANNVLFIGATTIDLGASAAVGVGDRFDVSATGTSQLALGSKNTLNLGSGIKGLTTGIRVGSIRLGMLTRTDITAAKGASVSSALRVALLKGLDASAAGVKLTINLA